MKNKARTTNGTAFGPAAIAVAMTIAMFGTMVAALDVKPFWLDEAYTGAAMLSGNIHDLLNVWVRNDVQTPIYYVIIFGWTRLFGLSDMALRLPSLLSFILTLAIMIAGGRRTLSLRTSLVWALAFSCSLIPIHYALEARVYALLMALSAATTISYVSVRLDDSLPRTTVFTILATLLAVTHYFGTVLAGAFYIRLLLSAINRREAWVRWGVSGFIAASAVTTLLAWQFPSLLAKSGANFWIPETSILSAIKVGLCASSGGQLGILIWGAFPLMITWSGTTEASSDRTGPSQLANELLLICALCIVAIALISTRTPLIVERYFSVFVPPALLTGALRMASIRWSNVTGWLVTGLAALSLLAVQPWRMVRQTYHPLDWSGASDLLRRKGVHDVIFVLDDPVARTLGHRLVSEMGRFFFVRKGYAVNVYPRIGGNQGAIPLQPLPRGRFGVIKVDARTNIYAVDDSWTERLLRKRQGSCSEKMISPQTCIINPWTYNFIKK